MKHRLLPYLLIAAVALSTAGRFAGAAAQPTLSWVLARHRSAIGDAGNVRLASSVHIVYTLAAGGSTGILERYVTPKRSRVEMTLGSLHQVTVDDGWEGWQQDSSGYVRLVRGPELGEDRTDGISLNPFSDALSGDVHASLHPGRDASTHDYVIDATPRGGKMQTVYVDPRTFLIAQVVFDSGGTTNSVSIQDYRRVEGVMTPSRLSMRLSGTVMLATLRSAEYGRPIDLALFRKPAPPQDFEFLHPSPATIPFDAQNRDVVVPVTIGGHEFRFLLDSGANDSFITADAAKAAGLSTKDTLGASGYGGTAKGRVTARSTIEIGGVVRLKGQILFVVDDPAFAASLQQSGEDGLLGYDLFERLIVRIDYPSRRLTLFAPEDGPRGTGASMAVPITLENRTPTVDAAVDGRKSGRFLVDTGDEGDLELYTRYARANNLIGKPSSPGATVRNGVGIGGAFHEVLTRGHRIAIGGIDVTGVKIGTAQGGGLSDAADGAGIIGAGILSRYIVTFDYPDGQLTLARPVP